MSKPDHARDLYEALFRIGDHRSDPVPLDPEALIRSAILAAEQREREACAALMIELAETEGDPADTEWAYRKGADAIRNRGSSHD